MQGIYMSYDMSYDNCVHVYDFFVLQNYKKCLVVYAKYELGPAECAVEIK